MWFPTGEVGKVTAWKALIEVGVTAIDTRTMSAAHKEGFLEYGHLQVVEGEFLLVESPELLRTHARA